MVKITQRPSEAAYYAANHIPYIVYLNENNRNDSFPNGSFCVEKLSDIDAEYMDKVYRRTMGLPWILNRNRQAYNSRNYGRGCAEIV